MTWTADGEGLPPEQFAEFQLSVGPFPDVDQIVFTATQTYSDGEVVGAALEEAFISLTSRSAPPG